MDLKKKKSWNLKWQFLISFRTNKTFHKIEKVNVFFNFVVTPFSVLPIYYGFQFKANSCFLAKTENFSYTYNSEVLKDVSTKLYFFSYSIVVWIHIANYRALKKKKKELKYLMLVVVLTFHQLKKMVGNLLNFFFFFNKSFS